MRLIRYDLESQATVLDVPLGGPFALTYSSDTMAGAVASHTARVPVVGEVVPDDLESIEVVTPDGMERLAPAPGLTHRVGGAHGAVVIRITYVFSDGARSTHEQRLTLGSPDPRTSEMGGFLLGGVPQVSAGRLYVQGRRSLPLQLAPDGRHHARLGGLIHVVERGEWVGSHDAVSGAVMWRLEDDRLRGPHGQDLSIDRGMRTVRLEHGRSRTDVHRRGEWASEIEQGDRTISVEFDDGGLLHSVTDATGTTSLQYDELGRLAEIASPETRFVFRREELADGFRVGVTNGLDVDERLEVRHRDDGVHTTKQCCGEDPVTVVRRSAGTETLRADGTRVMSVSSTDRSIARIELPSGAARQAEVRRTNSPEGSTSVTITGGEEWSTTWDPAARMVRRTSPGGRSETLEFDDHGRTIAHQAIDGRRFAFDYDGSRIIRSESADGEWSLDWDDDETVTWTGPTGEVESHRSRDRVRVVDENHVAMELTRTPEGFETTVNSHPYLSADVDGDLRRVRLGEMPLMSLNMDGAVTAVMSDVAVEMTSDSGGRPVTVAGDGVDRSYEWKDQRLQAAKAPEHQVEFTWDGPELVSVAQSGLVDGAVAYRRDDQGRVMEVDIVGERFGIRHEDGQVVELGPLLFQLDEHWTRPASAKVGDMVERFECDEAGRLIGREIEVAGKRVLSLKLEHDRAGRVRRRQLESDRSNDVEFTYDGGQLTREMSTDRDLRFAYDDAGRLVDVENGGSHRRFDVDTAGRLNMVDESPVQFTTGGRVSDFQLDGSVVAFGYAATGELVSITGESGVTRIDRDPLGRPIRIVRPDQPATGLVWDETGLAAKLDENGQVIERYVRRPGALVPELVVRGETVLRVVADQTGTILALVDTATGQVAENAASAYGDSFGEPASSLGFGGGVVLSVNPLVVDIGRRSYLPVIGRWLQWDPNLHEGGGTDLYGYAANDPVNRHDPTGAEVQRCSGWIYTAWSSGDDGGYRYVAMPAKHQWLKTGTYESGQDAKPGSPPMTEWADHRGRYYPGRSCEPMPDVDESCVNKRIKPGTDIGLYASPFHVTDHTRPFGWELSIPTICWAVVADVLDDCHVDNIPGGSCEAPAAANPPSEQAPELDYTPDLGYTPLEPAGLDYTPDPGYKPQGGPFGS